MTEIEFRADDRLLVLGAGGWFGRTLLDLVSSDVPVLATGSYARGDIELWTVEAVRDFKPTVVANFAFLTRERVEIDGLEEFVHVNEVLTSQFLRSAECPSVRAVLTVSSGAAVQLPLDMEANPYGTLKMREAEAALALKTDSLSTVVARAWSVSGANVRRPSAYAFSDFILQAPSGRIHVSSSQPVFRRYVSAADFLYVCVSNMLGGWSGTVDSGGEMTEMGPLAERVAHIVNPRAIVEREPMISSEPSVYASDNASWSRACEAIDFEPADLGRQIRETARGLLGQPLQRS